jgi:hypothetical protein
VTAAEAGAAAVILDHVWVGAGIHIHTGGSAEAREPFLPWRELPDDPDAVFALLSWHARLAPLTGREKDKDTLLRWARQGRNARIRLLSGPGGVGKSRLAAEVAEALRAEGGPPALFNRTIRSWSRCGAPGSSSSSIIPRSIRTRCGRYSVMSLPASCEMSRCACCCSAAKAAIAGLISLKARMRAS